MKTKQLQILQVSVEKLNSAPYNPRKWEMGAIKQLTESIKKFGLVDPILVNGAKERKDIVIGGHFRLKIAKDLGYKAVPVVYLNIPEIKKEKELNLRLNRNTGDWDFDMDLLLDVGFDDSDLSAIWDEALGVEDDEFKTRPELEKIENPEAKEASEMVKYRLENLTNEQKRVLCDLFVNRVEMYRTKEGKRWKIQIKTVFNFNLKKLSQSPLTGRTEKTDKQGKNASLEVKKSSSGD